MNNDLTVSVVVPAYNEQELIAKCIGTLLKELSDKDELIIVNNNSTDGTVRIVESYCNKDSRVKLVHEKNQGTMFARKTGFDMSKGELLSTVDADTQVLEGWRQNMVTALADDDVDAVSSYGHLATNHLEKFNSALANIILFRILPLLLGVPGFLFGSSMMIKRDVWEVIGKEVRLNKYIWDDYEITLLVNKHGKKIKTIKQRLFRFSTRRSLDSPKQLFDYAKNGRQTLRHYSKVRAAVLNVLIFITIGLVIILLKPVNVVSRKN